MNSLATAVVESAGQPATIRVGTVLTASPLAIDLGGTTLDQDAVGLLGDYAPIPGQPVALLGQSVQGGQSSGATWLAMAGVNASPRGLVLARHRRTTNSSTTTTQVAVLRLATKPVYVGHIYKVWSPGLVFDTSVNNDWVFIDVTFTTDGTAATAASAHLPGSLIQQQVVNAAIQPVVPLQCEYVPATDHQLSLCLRVGRVTGTGNVGIIGSADFPIALLLEDLGWDPGDEGVDL